MKFKWEMIMTTKKTLSPLAMGALTLTLGMSLVNNANASLIVGSANDTTTFASDVVVDASANIENFPEFEGDSVFFGEDFANLNVNIGDNSASILVRDAISSGIFAPGVVTSGSLDSNNNGLLFSVNRCGFTECLNQFVAGDVIDESWFDGTSGEASTFGILYEEGGDPEIVSDDFPVFGDLGNWEEVGDTGFVAFAYFPEFDIRFDDSIFEVGTFDEQFLVGELETTSIFDSQNIQFGFLEITRGSITINQAVIQNVTTSVPEPASLLLLGAGLFGLASRKKLKA